MKKHLNFSADNIVFLIEQARQEIIASNNDYRQNIALGIGLLIPYLLSIKSPIYVEI